MITLEEINRVYQGSDAAATKELYAQLGPVALNLMRTCKASERAKRYRGGNSKGSYRRQAYDKKNWAIGELCLALQDDPALIWGWGIDSALMSRGDPHHHVLYVELPTGQVSFHSGYRSVGPTYEKPWDGRRGMTAERICRWVAVLLGDTAAGVIPELEPPSDDIVMTVLEESQPALL